MIEIDDDLSSLSSKSRDIAERILDPHAAAVDREACWPRDGMRELGAAGLLGLNVPKKLGGQGQGLLGLAVICEILSRSCSSTAMCFGMHCVGTAVIAAKATPEQEERFLVPIAEGRHVTSLALSEPGTGAHFYLPRTTFRPKEECFIVDGTKSFVTNGGHADSYVVSVVAPDSEMDPGTFTCLLLEGKAKGLEWGPPWTGLGMRGNSSRSLRLNEAAVPKSNLLGEEGDQIWYVFEVIAPYFLTAMAGVYLGIAQAAFDQATAHLRGHRHVHTASRLAENPAIVSQVADMWIRLERARQLLHHAARLGDAKSQAASQAHFASKVEVADAAISITQDAIMLMGGRGYQEGGQLSRLLRDAHASHVMAPTTHLLKSWLGRTTLGLPPF